MGTDKQHLENDNVMLAYLTRPLTAKEIARLEQERFGLSQYRARGLVAANTREKKSHKSSTKGIDFEQWQLDLAQKVFERETDA